MRPYVAVATAFLGTGAREVYALAVQAGAALVRGWYTCENESCGRWRRMRPAI